MVIKAKTAGIAVITAGAADGSARRATCSLTVGNAVQNFTIAARGKVKNLAAGKNLDFTGKIGFVQ